MDSFNLWRFAKWLAAIVFAVFFVLDYSKGMYRSATIDLVLLVILLFSLHYDSKVKS